MDAMVGVIVYDRMHSIDLWMNAWHKSNKYKDTKICIVHNHSGSKFEEHKEHILSWRPDIYIQRKNYGMDIGALHDILHLDELDFKYLLWAVDHNIPVHSDFVEAFIEPFNKNEKLGLIGAYWAKGEFFRNMFSVTDHIRTSCFSIRRDVGKLLKFPGHYINKGTCYNFEWRDRRNNMTQQVLKLNYVFDQVENDMDSCWTETNKYIWDTKHLNMNCYDPRRKKNYTAQYESYFGAPDKSCLQYVQNTDETKILSLL